MAKTKHDGAVAVKINSRIYPLRVVYSCAYLFLEKAYISLDGDPKKQIIVRINAKNGTGSRRIAQEFLNELLNASLRYQISRENRKIREFIVGSALFSVSEQRPAFPVQSAECDGKDKAEKNRPQTKDASNAGKINDPLGIRIPWEKKYEKKDKG